MGLFNWILGAVGKDVEKEAVETLEKGAKEATEAGEKKAEKVFSTRSKIKDKEDYKFNKNVGNANRLMELDGAYDKLNSSDQKLLDSYIKSNAKYNNIELDKEGKKLEEMRNNFLNDKEARKFTVETWLNKTSKEDLSFGETLGYNKVPQKAASVGATAWLVSSMSSSKGHQSNAELYGQQKPYGM